jgi:hypothetical protein
VCQGRGRCLPEDDAGAVNQVRIIAALGSEFVQLVDIVVLGE